MACLQAAPAPAAPTRAEIAAFEEKQSRERLGFEEKIQSAPPGDRAKERLSFEKKKTEARRALSARLEGASPEDKARLLIEHNESRRRETAEHQKRMAKLEPDLDKFQAERAKFDKEANRKAREFYS